MQEISFTNQVAVVTGAGRGLGRSHALDLARRGAKVVVNDVGRGLLGDGGSEEPAEQVVAEIRSVGGQAVSNFDDVSDPAGAQAIVNTAVEAFGRIDVLVNNAGHGYLAPMGELDLDKTRRIIEVHLLGSIYTTNAAWPLMKQQGYGRVVLTTSGAGRGAALHTAYRSAKEGIIGLALTLAEEGAEHNIHVNVVSPVAFTRGSSFLATSDKVGHLYRPELVTAAVAYLASQDCQLNGVTLASSFGQYRRVLSVENLGYQADPREDITADDVAAHLEEIVNMSDAQSCMSPELAAASGARLAAALGEDAGWALTALAESGIKYDLTTDAGRQHLVDYIASITGPNTPEHVPAR